MNFAEREYAAFRCAECNGPRQGRLSDWFRCGEDKLCSVECAVAYLLRRVGAFG